MCRRQRADSTTEDVNLLFIRSFCNDNAPISLPRNFRLANTLARDNAVFVAVIDHLNSQNDLNNSIANREELWEQFRKSLSFGDKRTDFQDRFRGIPKIVDIYWSFDFAENLLPTSQSRVTLVDLLKGMVSGTSGWTSIRGPEEIFRNHLHYDNSLSALLATPSQLSSCCLY